MVSASHNPADDNGLKVLDGEGLKLDDDVEDELEGLIWREGELGGVGNADLGRRIDATDLVYHGHFDIGEQPETLLLRSSDEEWVVIPFPEVIAIRQLGSSVWSSRRGRSTQSASSRTCIGRPARVRSVASVWSRTSVWSDSGMPSSMPITRIGISLPRSAMKSNSPSSCR